MCVQVCLEGGREADSVSVKLKKKKKKKENTFSSRTQRSFKGRNKPNQHTFMLTEAEQRWGKKKFLITVTKKAGL